MITAILAIDIRIMVIQAPIPCAVLICLTIEPKYSEITISVVGVSIAPINTRKCREAAFVSWTFPVHCIDFFKFPTYIGSTPFFFIVIIPTHTEIHLQFFPILFCQCHFVLLQSNFTSG